MNDDIIQPGDDAEIPPEVMKQMQQEARISLGKAQTFAKAFVKRMEKEFAPKGASDFLAILAATTCDMLAEALVTMDELKVQPLDKAIPMFTKRLIAEIQTQQAKNDDKIVIARNTPPSRN